jgi:hypothetical protein
MIARGNNGDNLPGNLLVGFLFRVTHGITDYIAFCPTSNFGQTLSFEVRVLMCIL